MESGDLRNSIPGTLVSLSFLYKNNNNSVKFKTAIIAVKKHPKIIIKNKKKDNRRKLS